MLTPHRYVEQVPFFERGADVTVARAPVPVRLTVRWQDGHATEETGVALAWTRVAVEVRFAADFGTAFRVWLPLGDVRRA